MAMLLSEVNNFIFMMSLFKVITSLFGTAGLLHTSYLHLRFSRRYRIHDCRLSRLAGGALWCPVWSLMPVHITANRVHTVF